MSSSIASRLCLPSAAGVFTMQDGTLTADAAWSSSRSTKVGD